MNFQNAFNVDIPSEYRLDYKAACATIQEAIDNCSASGGGTVYIPSGEYAVTTIHLKSNVKLVMDKDCRLISAELFSDFEEIEVSGFTNYTGPFYGIIAIINAQNVSITGGRIIGSGESFWTPIEEVGELWNTPPPRYTANLERPMTLFFFNSQNITVTDLVIDDSPVYSGWFLDCSDLKFIGTRVINNFYGPNTDGYHFSSCKNVLVDHCYFKTGDDALAIDGMSSGLSRNTEIRNCEFDTSVNALRIYTGLDPHVSNLAFRSIVKDISMHHCKIVNAAGVMNITAQNGSISNVDFYSLEIEMEQEGTPFFFMTDCGSIENITIKDVTARANGIGTIIGTAEHFISNVTIENVAMEVTPRKKMYEIDIPDPIGNYSQHHYAPCNLFIRHAKDITLKDCSFKWCENSLFEHSMSAIRLIDTSNIAIDNVDAEPYGDFVPYAIEIDGGEDITVINSELIKKSNVAFSGRVKNFSMIK